MRHDRAPVQEERAVLVLAHVLERLLREPVVGVNLGVGRVARAGVPDGLDPVRQRHALLVAPQEVGEVVVRVHLVQVAEEIIKTVLPRQAALGRARVAEAPLADQGGRIPGALEHVRDRRVARTQRLRQRVLLAGVAAHAGVAVVQPGHEHAARGRADCSARVEVREAQPLARHAVEVRRPDHLLSVTPELAVAEIVGHDPDQIRLLRRTCSSCDQRGHQRHFYHFTALVHSLIVNLCNLSTVNR